MPGWRRIQGYKRLLLQDIASASVRLNASVLLDSENMTVPYTYYNSTCMSYSVFCGIFGLTHNSSDYSQEQCYDVPLNMTKKFTDLYKRYVVSISIQ